MIRIKSIIAAVLFATFVLPACTTPEVQTTDVSNIIEESSEQDDRSEEIPELIEQPSEVLFQNADIMVMIKQELESKGWSNLEMIEGEPDSKSLWGVIHEPTYLEEGLVLYSIIGSVKNDYYDPIMDDLITDKLISVVIKIVFSDNMPEGEWVDVYYVSDSGRTLDKMYLSDFFDISSEFDKIVTANDEDLWSFMCSY